MGWKAIVRAAARRRGYDITRLPKGATGDGYLDQARALGPAPAGHILDVGASTGRTVATYRALFPSTRIHCFEPFPESFAVLSRRFRDDTGVRCHSLALSDAAGTRRLYCNESSDTNSLLPPGPAHRAHIAAGLMEPRTATEVECTTLDAFCEANGVERVSALKLDVQGAELRVLAGAARLLRQGRVDLVYSELLFADLYEEQAWHFEVSELLADAGFALFRLFEVTYTDRGGLGWCDGLFLRR